MDKDIEEPKISNSFVEKVFDVSTKLCFGGLAVTTTIIMSSKYIKNSTAQNIIDKVYSVSSISTIIGTVGMITTCIPLLIDNKIE